jgi:hypothetical protein
MMGPIFGAEKSTVVWLWHHVILSQITFSVNFFEWLTVSSISFDRGNQQQTNDTDRSVYQIHDKKFLQFDISRSLKEASFTELW